jgi:hypothetical protein
VYSENRIKPMNKPGKKNQWHLIPEHAADLVTYDPTQTTIKFSTLAKLNWWRHCTWIIKRHLCNYRLQNKNDMNINKGLFSIYITCCCPEGCTCHNTNCSIMLKQWWETISPENLLRVHKKVTKMKGYVEKHLWKTEDTSNGLHRPHNKNKPLLNAGLQKTHYTR